MSEEINLDAVKAKMGYGGTPTPEPVAPEPETPPTEETTVVEPVDPISATTEPTTEPQATVEPTPEPVTPEKVAIDYTSWLEQHKSELKEYLNEKDRDYNTLSNEELVKLKFKKDNPAFDEQDVKEELKEKYGIGLSKIEIDEDEMSPEEIKEAKAQNALIDRGQRLLKQEASKAKDYFNEYKETIKLPEFEWEAPTPQETQTMSLEEQEQEIQKQIVEYKEKQWIPTLSKASEAVESLTHKVEIDDNGGKVALDINYKLSETEKKELVNHLADYVSHPSDKRYLKEDGTVDINTFFADKGKELFFDKLLRSGIKEALAKGRKGVIANDLLNFDDGAANQPRDTSHEHKSATERIRERLLAQR